MVAEIVELARAAGVDVFEADRATLDRLARGMVHQGIVADAPAPAQLDLDGLRSLVGKAAGPMLLMAVDGVTDPHNLGSIARSAEAIGASALILPARRNAPITPTVEKVAAGALAHLPVVAVPNLVRALGVLGDDGVWSLGLDADGESTVEEHPLAGESCVLVVGGEGGGLSRLVRQRCDALVRLQMEGRVASFNASVAAALAMYLVRNRQRA